MSSSSIAHPQDEQVTNDTRELNKGEENHSVETRRIEGRNLAQKKTRRNYNATHIPISIQPMKDWRALQLGDSDSVGPTGTLRLGDSDSVGPTGTQAPSYWRMMSYCRE